MANLPAVLRGLPEIADWLPGCQRSWLREDQIAGFTLAAYTVPVALAYASLAGLYGDMLGDVAYALFCSSRHAAVGPTSAIAIVIGGGLGALDVGDPGRYAALAQAA